MVFASLIGAVTGVVQTFWIPRLLSVNDFGHWRAFLLYIGYAGLLHLGLVDGSLLLWSKDPHHHNPNRTALDRATRFLAIEHLAIAAVVVVIWLRAPGDTPRVLLACVTYALLFNLVGLFQVYLQSHLRMTQVALGMSLPGALFVVFIALLSFSQASVGKLLVGYLAAWAFTLCVLAVLARRTPSEPSTLPQSEKTSSTYRFGFTCIATGWPIVLANTGLGLMQSADRVTVNLTRPIHDFAIYSLSQSTIYVPIAILIAISRVAFSYFAKVAHDDRASVYRSSTRVLTLLWMLLFPYYYAVEFVVRRFLPRYTPGLPAGRILLMSVLFLSLIQVLQLNTFSLEGRQKQFFIGSVFAVAVAFATAWIGSQVIGTLTAVAWSQVITAALWWIGNEVFLHRRTGVRQADILRVMAGFAISLSVVFGVQHLVLNIWTSSILYSLCVSPACLLLFWPEISLAVRMLQGRASTMGARIF